MHVSAAPDVDLLVLEMLTLTSSSSLSLSFFLPDLAFALALLISAVCASGLNRVTMCFCFFEPGLR